MTSLTEDFVLLDKNRQTDLKIIVLRGKMEITVSLNTVQW